METFGMKYRWVLIGCFSFPHSKISKFLSFCKCLIVRTSRLRSVFNSTWAISDSEKLSFFSLSLFLPFATLTTHVWFCRDAFSHVQERRFCINPNVGFVHQLQASGRRLNRHVDVQNSQKTEYPVARPVLASCRDVFETSRIGPERSRSTFRIFLFVLLF